MGTRGPIPKRSTQRRRSNSADTDSAPAVGVEYEPDPADENWHPVAKAFYEAAAMSGQTHYYEPSDWVLLWLTCENMSRDLKPKYIGVDPETGQIVRSRQPISGSSLNAYNRVMQELLITEGARRRSRIELVRGDTDPKVDARGAAIVSLRQRLA
jgi:hypothetical protein